MFDLTDKSVASLWMTRWGVISFVRHAHDSLRARRVLKSTNVIPTEHRFGLEKDIMDCKWALGHTKELTSMEDLKDQCLISTFPTPNEWDYGEQENFLNTFDFTRLQGELEEVKIDEGSEMIYYILKE